MKLGLPLHTFPPHTFPTLVPLMGSGMHQFGCNRHAGAPTCLLPEARKRNGCDEQHQPQVMIAWWWTTDVFFHRRGRAGRSFYLSALLVSFFLSLFFFTISTPPSPLLLPLHLSSHNMDRWRVASLPNLQPLWHHGHRGHQAPPACLGDRLAPSPPLACPLALGSQ